MLPLSTSKHSSMHLPAMFHDIYGVFWRFLQNLLGSILGVGTKPNWTIFHQAQAYRVLIKVTSSMTGSLIHWVSQ